MIAALLADGTIELPIDSVHPLEDVRDAYIRSIEGHATGKIVVVTSTAANAQLRENSSRSGRLVAK